MKNLMILALAVGSIAAVTPAAADPVVVQRTTVIRHDVSSSHHDNGWHAASAHQKRRYCRNTWRHHQRVRSCYWR